MQYQCCGIINQKDYDESKWKEQALGGDDLNYPLTCCVLNNPSDPQNYLNPMPKNKENCMNTSHQSKYRLDRYQPVSQAYTYFLYYFRSKVNKQPTSGQLEGIVYNAW